MNKAYALFLGCYIPIVQPFAESSFRKIATRLGIELIDMVGATCCPVSDIVRLVDYDSWVSIAARNLSIAESVNKDIVTLCIGCWESLHDARNDLIKNEQLRDRVNSKLSQIGRSFTGKSEVKHFLEVIVEDVGLNRLQEEVKRPLTNLKVAIQYGCKLFKSENEKLVTYFDKCVSALGLRKLNYGIERVCCGYPLTLYSSEMAIEERTKWKLDEIKKSGADCIVVVCPACYNQLERGQFELRRKNIRYDIPIVHLSELIGLAFGFSPREIGLDRHRISCEGILKKLGLGV